MCGREVNEDKAKLLIDVVCNSDDFDDRKGRKMNLKNIDCGFFE